MPGPGFTWTSGKRVSEFCRAAEHAVARAGDWFAEQVSDKMHAETRRNTPKETGHLRENIAEFPVLKMSWGWQGGVYATLDYAPYVEYGTGLWGPKHAKYKIEPKKPGGVLAFFSRLTTPEGKPVVAPEAHKTVAEGSLVFARYVMHPGSPGQHMFTIGGAMAEHDMERLGREAFARVEAELGGFG